MSTQNHSRNIVQIPIDLKLVYHAEGAANIVYRVVVNPPPNHDILSTELDVRGSSSPDSTELESWETRLSGNEARYEGKVLRLRKDRPYGSSPLESQQEFERLIQPLFEEDDLIQSAAVKIDQSLVSRLNAELKLLEQTGARPTNRTGVYLRQEQYATVMDDIGLQFQSIGKVLELKPKWLLQSPDAPKGAKRCRTCALRALRAASKSNTDHSKSSYDSGISRQINGSQSQQQLKTSASSTKTGFCPLVLTLQNEALIEKALKQHLIDEQFTQTEAQQIVKFLAKSRLLKRLKQLQGSLYPIGVLHADQNDKSFLTTMTLRDCSLFLTQTPSGSLSARLGDLDLKSAARAEHWRDTERQLLEGGWYEKPLHDVGLVRCILER